MFRAENFVFFTHSESQIHFYWRQPMKEITLMNRNTWLNAKDFRSTIYIECIFAFTVTIDIDNNWLFSIRRCARLEITCRSRWTHPIFTLGPRIPYWFVRNSNFEWNVASSIGVLICDVICVGKSNEKIKECGTHLCGHVSFTCFRFIVQCKQIRKSGVRLSHGFHLFANAK